MKVFDVKGTEYELGDTLLMERGEKGRSDYRAIQRVALSKVGWRPKRLASFYFSEFSQRYVPLIWDWFAHISFFSRLHIGCRTFDRKNTKLIIEWAKGAQ